MRCSAATGIGFGGGIERLVINLKRDGVQVPPDKPLALFIAHMAPAAERMALQIARDVRLAGLTAVVGPAGRSLKAQLRQANTRGARYAAIIGEREAAAGEVTLRDLASHEERQVPAGAVVQALVAPAA